MPAAFSTTIRPDFPARPTGTVKVSEVSELMTKLATYPFILTEVVPVNPDPVKVIVEPTACVVGVPEEMIAGTFPYVIGVAPTRTISFGVACGRAAGRPDIYKWKVTVPVSDTATR